MTACCRKSHHCSPYIDVWAESVVKFEVVQKNPPVKTPTSILRSTCTSAAASVRTMQRSTACLLLTIQDPLLSLRLVSISFMTAVFKGIFKICSFHVESNEMPSHTFFIFTSATSTPYCVSFIIR